MSTRLDPAQEIPDTGLHNLPVHLTSFVGREQEVAELVTLLETARLLTLTGPGGIGKTRLALAAAAQVVERYADGVWFVDLSGVADPAGVIPAIAQVLGVRESEGRTLAVALTAYLRRKRLLLVLDNFEQVVEAAPALYELLAAASRLVLLVTSRVLLRQAGEQEYVVAPLPVPVGSHTADPAVLQRNPAVQLFLDRVRALRPELALTTEALRAIAEICSRLDGLPLALELAAARVKLLPPAALLARLEHRLPLLTGGARSLPARQQTLRATIAWSWELLTPDEQMLFRRLGVFAGGWTLAAAEAICSAGDDLDALAGLASLIDKSLVQQTEVDGEPRFTMLATLREFALEQNEAAGEAMALAHAHATYYCRLAEEAENAYWRTGRAGTAVLSALDPEQDNLRAALTWALTQEDVDLGQRLAGAVGIWSFFRAPSEGRRWAERMLALPGGEAPTLPRASALVGAGTCAIGQGEFQAAVAYMAEAAAIFRVADERARLSHALAVEGCYLPADAAEEALTLVEEAVVCAQSTGQPYTLAFAEGHYGMMLVLHGQDPQAARVHLEKARGLARTLEADLLQVGVVAGLAMLALQQAQHEDAGRLWHEVQRLAETLGDRAILAWATIYLALLASGAGNSAEAAAAWRRGLVLAGELGNRPLVGVCLAGIAGLLAAAGQYLEAVRLLAASEQAWRTGEQHPVVGAVFHAAYDPALAVAQTLMSAAEIAQVWTEGQTLSQDQATDVALAALASTALSPTPAKLALKIEIDEERRAAMVRELTESTAFQDLVQQAKARHHRASAPSADG